MDRTRLTVLVSRRRLDWELAAGCGERRTGALAMRARQLTVPSTRRRLARSLRRVVSDVEARRAGGFRAALPLRHNEVRAYREGLLGIAERLEQPAALSACGVARAIVLLTDGCGPLYYRYSERSLIDAIWWIADGMDSQCPPHDWASPVIMKRDPNHVAWTCKRCGSIATSSDTVVKPA